MSIFAGLFAAGAATGIVNSARRLVHEAKAPRMSQKEFSALLHEQINRARHGRSKESIDLRAERATDSLWKSADVDRNGFLDRTESGMGAGEFARLDADGDGKLSRDELRSHVRAQVAAAAAGGGKKS